MKDEPFKPLGQIHFKPDDITALMCAPDTLLKLDRAQLEKIRNAISSELISRYGIAGLP